MDIMISHELGQVPVTVFHVKGDINTETYEQLQAAAQQACEAGTRDLLLDLSEVPYVSSYGIRAISHIFKLMRSDSPSESDEAVGRGLRAGTFKSSHFKLANPTPQVLEVLKVSGVDMFLEIFYDLKTAVASF